ncbi:DUF6602 domain-containing protein [Rhizobium leguminosarum]|uniref:DUF6602 domain-containing protein n=1 Tax=Rhizobium leguminosarum TaxID=384 RepID=UPI001C955ED2|nr:DUF6602 domain-containing protein [Rhizobium leguminosarum]MBY5725226.1 hypothetical protein [Rhizobium leguminosarum]
MHPLSSLRHRDVFLPLADPLAQQRRIAVRGNGVERIYWIENSTIVDEQITISDELAIFRLPERGSDEARMVDTTNNVVSYLVYHSKSGQLSFDVLKSLAVKTAGVNPILVEPTIRLMLSEGMLKASPAKKRDGAVIIGLTGEGRRLEQIRIHATMVASDLKDRSQQLGQLIGHRPTIGADKEELLRSFLEQRLPRRYHVATGFVHGFDQQIDILIYDQIDYAPLFRVGNLVVVPREAVRAVIEVKSYLSRSKFRTALKQVTECARPQWPSPPVFKGIFAFGGISAAPLIEEWKSFHRLPSDDPDDGISYVPITDIYTMVDMVCIPDKLLLASGYTDNTEPRPMIEELGSYAGRPLQAAVFFDMLDRYLRIPLDGPIKQIPLAPYYYCDIRAKAEHYFYKPGELAYYLSDRPESDIFPNSGIG